MSDRELVLIHDATGDEYPFSSRSDYTNTLAGGGYTEKYPEGADDEPQRSEPMRQEPPRRPAPTVVPGTPQARPVPVEQQD